MFGLAGLLMVVAVLLGIVSFVASFWLMVLAFKRHVAWGLAVLFVPFAIVVYAIKHWSESRKPFLISLGSGVASTVLMFVVLGMSAAAIAGEMAALQQQAESQQTIDEPEIDSEPPPVRQVGRSTPSVEDVLGRHPEAGTRPTTSGSATLALPSVTTNGTSAPNAAFDMSELTRDGFAPVALTQAKNLVGRDARVVASDGRVHRGALVKADGRSVEIERAFNGGTLVVEFRKPEIKTLLVSIEP